MDILQWTVNEALLAAPQIVGTLNRLGVDTCCGGTQTLAEAAGSIGLAPEELLAALEPALKTTK
jgi:regulator of cell morphogenesis and NO signaling